jgi:hypothetical protein
LGNLLKLLASAAAAIAIVFGALALFAARPAALIGETVSTAPFSVKILDDRGEPVPRIEIHAGLAYERYGFVEDESCKRDWCLPALGWKRVDSGSTRSLGATTATGTDGAARFGRQDFVMQWPRFARRGTRLEIQIGNLGGIGNASFYLPLDPGLACTTPERDGGRWEKRFRLVIENPGTERIPEIACVTSLTKARRTWLETGCPTQWTSQQCLSETLRR